MSKLVLYISVFIAFSRALCIPIPVSLPVYYGWFAFVGLYTLSQGPAINWTTVLFLIAGSLSIAFNDVETFFQPWFRLISFGIMVAAIGPLNQNLRSARLRIHIYRIVNRVIVIGVLISFVGYFVRLPIFWRHAGLLNGMFNHSMMLGPLAGIAMLVCLQNYLSAQKTGQKRKYLIAACICALTCLLAGSRAALAAMMVGAVFLLWIRFRRNKGKFFKVLASTILGVVLLSPIWLPYTDAIEKKNQANEADFGSALGSRGELWQERLQEFYDSPVFGQGFSAMNTNIASQGFNILHQSIEPGSSWLFLLSSTGLLGLVFFCAIAFPPLVRIYRSNAGPSSEAVLLAASLIVFFVHMTAEGYVISSGGFLFFYLWLMLGCAQTPTLQMFPRDEKYRTEI